MSPLLLCAAVPGVSLPFQVVSASSSDVGYEAAQLELANSRNLSRAGGAEQQQQQQQQTPQHIKGWQSAKSGQTHTGGEAGPELFAVFVSGLC